MKISGIINLADILGHSSDGFFLTDVQGKLLYCNPATNPLVGINMFEFKSMDDLLKNKLIDRSTALEAIQRRGTVSGEVKSITGNRVIATSTLVYDLNGNPDGVICNIKNVSAFLADSRNNPLFLQDKKNASDFNIVQIGSGCEDCELVYASTSMDEIVKLALNLSQVDSSVLLYGETGVGKDLIARLIHDRSPRNNKGPFVKVNCASIPINLFETELFGYEAGSFTDASKTGKIGFFEMADGGTLFLDEVAELPLAAQSKILNVLQDKQILKVGNVRPKSIDIRIIAATNRNLQKMIEEGKLRKDLYYRLSVVPLEIPPLRERRVEIPLFFSYFQNKYQVKYVQNNKEISQDVIKHLYWYPWPGNVRELANLVERLLVTAKGNAVEVIDLPPTYLNYSQHRLIERFSIHSIAPLKEITKEFELAVINEVMKQSKNQKEAAEMLGISFSSLSRKLKG